MAKLAEALSGQGSGAEWGGAAFVQIDGSTDSYDRRLAVNRFRDDPTIQVALLSVTAAGVTPSPSGFPFPLLCWHVPAHNSRCRSQPCLCSLHHCVRTYNSSSLIDLTLCLLS